ncbi:MAG TPA: hypothetical protein VJL59_22215 [Anaerolineales bacterium]|nr:hypothetical protein [Anaerolineales bacterium]
MLFFIVFGLSYWGSTVLIDTLTEPDSKIQLPRQIAMVPSALRTMQRQFRAVAPWNLDGKHRVGDFIVPTLVAFVLALFFYGFIAVVWGFVRGNRTDPRDVRTPTAVSRKRKIRRCR